MSLQHMKGFVMASALLELWLGIQPLKRQQLCAGLSWIVCRIDLEEDLEANAKVLCLR